MGVYQLYSSQFRNKASWKWTHHRRNLFILELDPIVAAERVMEGKPVYAKQANPRHKILKRIHWEAAGLYLGNTASCQFWRAWEQRKLVAEQLVRAGHTIINYGG